MTNHPRLLIWCGDSEKVFNNFPARVKKKCLLSLEAARQGVRPPAAKMLSGFKGGTVLQLAESADGGTFRVVFTVGLRGAIYALHAFQKKSKAGKKTLPSDIERVKTRLKVARQDHEKRFPDGGPPEVEPG